MMAVELIARAAMIDLVGMGCSEQPAFRKPCLQISLHSMVYLLFSIIYYPHDVNRGSVNEEFLKVEASGALYRLELTSI